MSIMDNEQKTISLPEGIMMFLIVVMADIIEVLVSFTGFGIIIGEIINFSVGALIEGWLFFKGVKGIWKLASFPIGFAADGLFGSLFPVKTITLLITIYLVNHPEIMEKAASIAPAVAKK